MTSARVLVLATAALLAALPGPAAANPGDLDPTFNGGALVLLDLAKTGSNGTALHAARVDAAGRIVVAGSTLDESLLLAAALARLLPDGSLDPSFGDAGKTVTQAGRGGGTIFSMLGALAARPGVGGWAASGGASASDGRQAVLALAVDDNGHLDLSFGTGGSTRAQAAGAAPAFTLAFGGGGGGAVGADGSIFVGHAIAVDPMHTTDTRLVVVKLTPDGGLADGFGTMGVYANAFSQTGTAKTTYGSAALPTSDGILVTGSTLDAAGHSAVLLVRLTPGGALDGTFAGGAGYRVVQASDPAAPADSSQGVALAPGPGGVIYVAGTANDSDGHAALAVARFSATGTLDTTFGDAGIARVQTGTADPGQPPASFTGGVAVQADGSVLVIGSSGSRDYTEIVVVRLTPRGDLDSTFGTGGVVRLQPATGSKPETFGFGGSIAPDGSTLVVVGQMRQLVGGRGVVARILLTSASTTTTTVVMSSTTTTTLACAAEATVVSVGCRLDGLAADVGAQVPAGKLRDKLLGQLASASALLQEAGGATSKGARRRAFRRVVKALAGSRARLNTKRAKAIDASLRSALADRLTALERDAKTLRKQPY